MDVSLISNSFSVILERNPDFLGALPNNLTVRNWKSLTEQPIDEEIVILDLEDPELGTSIGRADSLTQVLDPLSSEIPSFLKAGGVIITLVGESINAVSQNRFEWITELGIGEFSPRINPNSLKLLNWFQALTDYFEYVPEAYVGVRLNEEVITDPQIIAKHPIDNETLAVALYQFTDLENEQFESTGALVILPYPNLNESNIIPIASLLQDIGSYYHNDATFSGLPDPNPDPFIDMEYILNRGETEKIEYKKAIPSHANDLAKEISALANHRGGVVALGVDNAGNVEGLDDVDSVEERVSGMVRTVITPSIYPRIEKTTHEGKDVLLIRVFRQGPMRHVDGRFYTRVGTTTDRMDWRRLKDKME